MGFCVCGYLIIWIIWLWWMIKRVVSWINCTLLGQPAFVSLPSYLKPGSCEFLDELIAICKNNLIWHPLGTWYHLYLMLRSFAITKHYLIHTTNYYIGAIIRLEDKWGLSQQMMHIKAPQSYVMMSPINQRLVWHRSVSQPTLLSYVHLGKAVLLANALLNAYIERNGLNLTGGSFTRNSKGNSRWSYSSS